MRAQKANFVFLLWFFIQRRDNRAKIIQEEVVAVTEGAMTEGAERSASEITDITTDNYDGVFILS